MRLLADIKGHFQTSPSLGRSCAKSYFLVFLLVFSIAIAFAVFTNHAWEDYYITFRASKNLATGHGLVFTAGEKIHTFTSPLGALIPALLSLATGNASDELVLWLFRVLSASAFSIAAVLLLRIARAFSLGTVAAVFLVGMVALDAKTIDFSINGMETGLMILFLSLTLNALVAPVRFPSVELGLAWAGLMWTRPDSFIYIEGLALGFLLFNAGPRVAPGRRRTIRLFVSAGLLAALLYVPWAAWAWHYYGSPIPNTVIAKGISRHSTLQDLVIAFPLYPLVSLLDSRCFSGIFLPAYASSVGWLSSLFLWSRGLAWAGAFIWVLPVLDRRFRAVSFALMLGGFYLDAISPYPFPWYLPPCMLLAVVALSGIVQRLPGMFRWDRRSRAHEKSLTVGSWFAIGFSTLALFISMILSVSAAYQLRIQQRVIEEGNRKEIGLWLAGNSASKSETVFLEALGYIGYYSQLKMLDFPGLSSREVIEARKKLGSDKAAGLIRELKPDWIVLRPREVQSIEATDPDLFVRTYQTVKVFDVSDKVASYRWLPGRDYLIKDQTYTVFRRRT